MEEITQWEKSENHQLALVIPAVAKPKRKRRRIVESPKWASEDSFEPEFHQYKKVGLPVDKKRVISGSWGPQENRIYLDFLQTYKKDFDNEISRRKSTVFNRLSKALRKRTPDQCRSHHQKLQNRFQNDINAIIEFVREKVGKQLLENEDKNFKSQLLLKATGTGTCDLEQIEPFEIDLESVMMW